MSLNQGKQGQVEGKVCLEFRKSAHELNLCFQVHNMKSSDRISYFSFVCVCWKLFTSQAMISFTFLFSVLSCKIHAVCFLQLTSARWRPTYKSCLTSWAVTPQRLPVSKSVIKFSHPAMCLTMAVRSSATRELVLTYWFCCLVKYTEGFHFQNVSSLTATDVKCFVVTMKVSQNFHIHSDFTIFSGPLGLKSSFSIVPNMLFVLFWGFTTQSTLLVDLLTLFLGSFLSC